MGEQVPVDGPGEMVERLAAATNAHDLDALEACFAPEYVNETPVHPARGFTGRDKIVKFEGQYHGVHDYALVSVAPNNMAELGAEDNPVALAWGRGIPEAISRTIVPARYNNIEFLRKLFEREADQIAAIIVEPVLGNAADRHAFPRQFDRMYEQHTQECAKFECDFRRNHYAAIAEGHDGT